MDIRARTSGEILDDACRLVLADAWLLLGLPSLFCVPAAVGLLLLVAEPAERWGLLAPAAAAGLLPLTGLASGACQAAFRKRSDGKTPVLGQCLGAGCRRALSHVAARAVVLLLVLLAAPF